MYLEKNNSKVQVSEFKYLGSWISDKWYATKDMWARISLYCNRHGIVYGHEKNVDRKTELWVKEAQLGM